MVKLIWTEEANNWLKDIYDYISKDNSETAARGVVKVKYCYNTAGLQSFSILY